MTHIDNPYQPPMTPTSVTKPVDLRAKLEKQMRMASYIAASMFITCLLVLWPGNYFIADVIYKYYGIAQGLMVIQAFANLVLIIATILMLIVCNIAYKNAKRRLDKILPPQ